MSFEFPRPNAPALEGGQQPLNRSWLQWLRDLASSFYNHWTDGDIHTTEAEALEAAGAVTLDPTGFVDRTSSAIAFDGATRTFSITPTATSFDFYIRGEKFTSTGDTAVIADTTGTHFVYFEDNGNLTSSTTAWSFEDAKAFVAIVYWNADDSDGILMDERHGCAMSWATHQYLHTTIGARWESGLALGDFVVDGNGASNTHAQFSVAAGVLHDEDIVLATAAKAATVGLRVLYLDGTDWTWSTNAGYSVLTTGTGRLAWNDGGTLAEVPNNDFVLCHIFGWNESDGSPVAVMGQNTYGNLGDARDGAETEINSLVLAGLPTPEMRAVGTVIFQTSNSYTNAVKARIRTTGTGDDYIDWRTTSAVPGFVTPDYLLVANIDDTPVDGEIAAPISSNWAYDHVAATAPHAGYVKLAGESSQTVAGTLQAEVLKAVTTNIDGGAQIACDSDGAQLAVTTYGSNIAGTLAGFNKKDNCFIRTGSGATPENLVIGTGASKAVAFIVGDAEKMRLTSDGKYCYGSTSPTYPYEIHNNASDFTVRIFNDGNNVNRYGMVIQCGEDDQSQAAGIQAYYIGFRDGDGTNEGWITCNNGTVQIEQSSDERRKTNIADSKVNALDRILALKVREFNWKGKNPEKVGAKRDAGFIAQEVKQVLPAACGEGTPDENGERIQTICLDAFVPYIVKAIQEQQHRIIALEERLIALATRGSKQ